MRSRPPSRRFPPGDARPCCLVRGLAALLYSRHDRLDDQRLNVLSPPRACRGGLPRTMPEADSNELDFPVARGPQGLRPGPLKYPGFSTDPASWAKIGEATLR